MTTPSDTTLLRQRLQDITDQRTIMRIIAAEILARHHRASAREIASLLLDAAGVGNHQRNHLMASAPTRVVMAPKPSTVEELLDYWPGNIPFKGSLVSADGTCMCAQGQALHFLDGLTADELRNIDQAMADKRVAELFGISTAHSVLLRIVNDTNEGAPTCVIRNPEQVIGDQAQTVLKFWQHLDRMSEADWEAAAARAVAREAGWAAAAARAVAREAGWAVDWEAAAAAARAVARAAAAAAARAVAREAGWAVAREAVGATRELQGAAVMRANNQPFFFLPLFGFAGPEDVIAHL